MKYRNDPVVKMGKEESSLFNVINKSNFSLICKFSPHCCEDTNPIISTEIYILFSSSPLFYRNKPVKQVQTTKNQVLETANDIMKYKNIWNEEENQNDKKSKVKGMKVMIIL